MGSLGKSSQNVGVQSCYFNAISATNDTTLSPAIVALHRHSQLTGEEATGINIGPIYVVLRTQSQQFQTVGTRELPHGRCTYYV